MQLYNYNPTTGRYLGASPADPDPERPGHFLEPAYTTPTPPPATAPGYAPFFDRTARSWRVDVATPTDAPPAAEDLAATARTSRDARLAATDWLVTRHRDQRDAGGAATLSPEAFGLILAYRQALRDVPQQAQFPDSINWPTA